MLIAMVFAVFIAAIFVAAVFIFLFLRILIVLFVLVFHNDLLIDNNVEGNRIGRKRRLFSNALKRQVQFHVALFCLAERTNFPSLFRYVHITAFATNPQNGFFAFIML